MFWTLKQWLSNTSQEPIWLLYLTFSNRVLSDFFNYVDERKNSDKKSSSQERAIHGLESMKD